MAKYVIEGNKECGQAFKIAIEAEDVDMLGGHIKFVDADKKTVALLDSYSAKRIIRDGAKV